MAFCCKIPYECVQTDPFQPLYTKVPNLPYNNFDVAYAVGVVFHLIVEQDIALFQYIESQVAQGCNDKQRWGLQMMKYVIYQLEKNDPSLYLGCILANSKFLSQPIPNQLQLDLQLSKIYSFVFLSEWHLLLKPFQYKQLLIYEFWNKHSNQNINRITDNHKLFFYQPAPQLQEQKLFNSPILVLVKQNIEQVYQRVAERYQLFIRDVQTQLTLDAITKTLSPIFQYLEIQPFKYDNLKELAQVLFCGQPYIEDRIQKFIKIPQIEKTLKFLIQKGFSNQMIQFTIEEKPLEVSPLTNKTNDYHNVFQTSVPTIKNNVYRGTMF